MSIQQALKFIQHCRQLTAESGDRNPYLKLTSLAAVVERAGAEGFDFTIADLRQAHAVDWKMRLIVANGASRSMDSQSIDK